MDELDSSALRLVGKGDNGEWVDESNPPSVPVVDEETGYGAWETVSVREVDVKAEKKARKKAKQQAKLEEQQQREEETVREHKLKTLGERLDAEGDDAMSSFDPWGTGMYKGVRLVAAMEAPAQDSWVTLQDPMPRCHPSTETSPAVAPVNFKKRKVARGSGSKQFRRKHAGDGEE